MKKLALFLALAFVFVAFAPVFAAPLFPDVPAEHWARDAVANLAAKGLLEGYPDGTFKGDRAATRWEMAMVVARLLAKMEQADATFATKADLEELQKLVNSLKDELAALGVRVGNLEDNVKKIDARVTDLEKIRFSGSIDSIFVTNSFIAKDSAFANGIPQRSSIDYLTGRPYMFGTSFSAKANLGVNAKLSDDFSGGLSLSAFSNGGDSVVGSLYGVSAPYLSNFFTQRSGVDMVSNTFNAPYTRMTLDNFWLKYNPSGAKLVVGSFDSGFDGLVYAGQLNPNINGPKYLNNYGFQVAGPCQWLKGMDYEVIYTKLADGNSADYWNTTYSAAYDSFATGVALKWAFDKGSAKLNILRAANDTNGMTPNGMYKITDPNGSWSQMLQWINPQEYNCAESTDPSLPNKMAVNAGELPGIMGANGAFALGPQGVSLYGLNFKYEFSNIKADLDLGSSTYKPNVNAGYKKTGGAFNLGLAGSLMKGALDLGLSYLSVDPYYDPMILQYPYGTNGAADLNTNGVMTNFGNMYLYRFGDFNYFADLYQLHDSEKLPNNRTGIRFKADYKFNGEDGKVGFKFASLTQQKVSSYDVKYTGAITGNNYAGFSPGWIDPLFTAVAALPGTAGAGWLPSEENKGSVTNFGLSVGYKFKGGLMADLMYDGYTIKRKTGLDPNASAALCAAVYNNYIDVKSSKGKLGLAYPLNDKFLLKGGLEFGGQKGHHAALARNYGLGYAYLGNVTPVYAQSNNFDYIQSTPYLGFDYKLSKSATWGLNLRFVSVQDKIGDDIRGLADGGTNNLSKQTYNGTQIFTEVKISF